MIQFTEAQFLAWITPLLWPFVRMLALFGTLPVLSMRNVPARLRVALALFITLCAQPSLPEIPVVALDSALALMLLLQQVLIGISLGFAARIVFTAVEFAGELAGLQMGMNFAMFFDPMTGGEATAVSRFFGVTVGWLFIVINGHLLFIAALIRSFQTFPVSAEPFGFLRATQPQVWGAEIFVLGLWIALPLLAMLLFVNLMLGVISRVAQQMNIFAIGFPITLGAGLVGVLLTLPMFQVPMTLGLERMLGHFL